MSNLPIKGGCFCGQVRYVITEPVAKMGVCHCHSCQKLTGGTAWPFVFVPKTGLKITGNTTSFSRKAISGKQVEFSFCSHCGTNVFGKTELWPDMMSVSGSTFDEPAKFQAELQVWTDDAQSWVVFDDKIPHFSGRPT